MLMPTSSEFVALCRAQVALLTQVLGATLSVVYLTEELVEGAETRLVPIVAWPETALIPERSGRMARLSTPEALAQARPKQLAAAESAPALVHNPALPPPPAVAEPDRPLRQLVVPLVHEGLMLGLLVTERDDRAWSEWDHSQIDRIAQTLALGCVLDQRAQWLHQTQQQQHLLQTQQHEVLDNLLHQFRNPLTALRTFGKLLLKRLQPGENNYEVATSMVRESDRLQTLLKQFDQAIDRPELENLPLELAPMRPLAGSIPPAAPPLLPAGVLTVQDVPLVPCAVMDVLTPLLLSTTAMAQEKGLLVRTAIAPQLPAVWANAEALCEVLSNLLDNAVKYTPTGGQIHVRVTTSIALADLTPPSTPLPAPAFLPPAQPVIICISDTGAGIPAQDLPHLFERHYRGVQATGQIPGTGLGLAIARSLTQQMQGDIQVICPLAVAGWVGTEPPLRDRGTTIAVWLASVKGSERVSE